MNVVIRLLGEVGAAVDGQVVPVLATQRMTRLVARLTLAGGAWVSRDQLARELWPDSTAAQARTNLRKLIHNLRRSLPGPPHVVDAAGDRVRWSAGPAVWVDVVAFLDALAQGDPAGAMGSFGGDLLPGCDDDWVVAERERLRRLAVEALASLADSADAAGRDTEVVEHARRLQRIDPLHERACRLLMQALTRQGERGEALRSYERLAERLGDRARGRAGAGDDRNGRPASARRSGGGASPPPWSAGRPSGRRPTTRGGRHPGAAPGCSVSRARRASASPASWRSSPGGWPRDGDAVVYSRAYEAAGRPPWGSVIDWLRSGPVRPCLDTLDPACLTELARLLPELRLAHPGLPDAPPATDPGRRHHLLVAVAAASWPLVGRCCSSSTTSSGATRTRWSSARSSSGALRRLRSSSPARCGTKRPPERSCSTGGVASSPRP